jgi:hypothetical protein
MTIEARRNQMRDVSTLRQLATETVTYARQLQYAAQGLNEALDEVERLRAELKASSMPNAISQARKETWKKAAGIVKDLATNQEELHFALNPDGGMQTAKRLAYRVLMQVAEELEENAE